MEPTLADIKREALNDQLQHEAEREVESSLKESEPKFYEQ